MAAEMIQKKSDDAISPVIGVMLMLVITVVIAAVITTFATGVVGDTEPAPVAVLDVKILSNEEALIGLAGPDFQITHISGDPIDTGDVEIRLSWTHDNNCYHYSTYTAEKISKKYPVGKDEGGQDTGGLSDLYGVGMQHNQPMYVKSTMSGGKGPDGLSHYFGEVTLTPGLKLMASPDILDYGTNVNKPYQKSVFMDLIFNNAEVMTTGNGIMDHLKPGTAVDVMIVHIPSNKAIYDNQVIVQ